MATKKPAQTKRRKRLVRWFFRAYGEDSWHEVGDDTPNMPLWLDMDKPGKWFEPVYGSDWCGIREGTPLPPQLLKHLSKTPAQPPARGG